jgi:iron(III) transport system ATP-binding protein
MTRLTVERLAKSFRDTPVLRGIDLDVEPGTLTAILGASGAGKTTLLRVIAGFEAAGTGTVTLDGVVVEDGRRRLPPERRRIGYVPQDGALFPHLTVRANAAFSLPRRERRGPRPDEILRLVGLTGLGDRFPHQLSGGQQQRVAIARALASRPRLVLLDEPFASLDAALRASVRADVLGVLRSTGTTTLLVTHDQDEALSAADHVAVMRDGAITQAGTPREIYQRPADPWTASFVGTANLVPGRHLNGSAVSGGSAGGDAGTREPADGHGHDEGGKEGGQRSAGGGEVRTALGRHRLYPELSYPAFPPGRAGGAPADVTVLIRPEQICLVPPRPGTSAARVSAARYHGHDALVTVRPESSNGGNGRDTTAGDVALHVRITGAELPRPGERVSLEVQGPVMAWPAAVPSGHH